MSSASKPIYPKLSRPDRRVAIIGRYPEGAILPSVRALAPEQGADPLAVANAFEAFRGEGLLRVQRGVGRYVNPGAPMLRESEGRGFVDVEGLEIVRRIERLGLVLRDLLAWV